MAYLTGALLAEELMAFGADPLLVSAEEFASRIRSRNAQIKALLLDQSVLRGVGNIYADESLWRGKNYPGPGGGGGRKKKKVEVCEGGAEGFLEGSVGRGLSVFYVLFSPMLTRAY